MIPLPALAGQGTSGVRRSGAHLAYPDCAFATQNWLPGLASISMSAVINGP